MEKREEERRDRISDLPTEIKQNILSSLCMKDAIATSCLSPRWRYSWLTLPFFDFGNQFYHQFAKYFNTLPKNDPKRQHLYHSFHDDIESTDDDWYEYTTDDNEDYSDEDKDDIPDWKIVHIGYVQLLDQILQIYIKNRQPEVFMKKLSIYVPINPSDSKATAYASNVVSHWLLLAKHGLEELTCEISGCIIPDDTLQNCNGILNFKTLTYLELQKCNLTYEDDGDVLIDLPYLKQLCFKNVHLHQKLLDILLSKCGALEKLTLSSTRGVKVLRVPRLSKLKEVSLTGIPLLDRVEINAMALQCLTLQCLTLRQLTKCKVKVASNSCKTLAELCIIGCAISDDFFNKVTEFPHLETVTLLDCPTLTHIKITSNCLTAFRVERCPNLGQIELNTPNLSSFRYYTAGNTNIVTLLSKCQIARVSLIIMHPREANFDQHLWDSKLIALLTNFSQSEYVHLATNSKKEIGHLRRLATKLLPSNFRGPRFFPFSCEILNMSYSSAIFG